MTRYTRASAPSHLLRYDDWAEYLLEGLDAKAAIRASKLRKALIRYISGDPVAVIREEDGFSAEQLIRALNRCISTGSDGRVIGWVGLLSNLCLGTHDRKSIVRPSGPAGKAGLKGVLGQFMKDHPNIKGGFDEYLKGPKSRAKGKENKIRHSSAHKYFIKLCRTAGITDSCWPLNMEKHGAGAVRAYVNAYIDANYNSIVDTQFGSKAATKSKSGTGVFTRLRATQYLDVVELDEHLCHFRGWIGIDAHGGTRWQKGVRLTIIAMIDRAFQVIVGMKVMFRTQARADDILDVAHNACLGGPSPVQFSGSSTSGIAMPCDLGAQFQWCAVGQLLLDNALSHLATEITGRLRRFLGCDINYGPVRRPERRPNVEGLFSSLARHGFHRLTATTGSHPQDPIRATAPPASEPQMTEKQAIDLIYRCAFEFNRSYGKAGLGLRKIEHLQSIAGCNETGMLLPLLPPALEGIPSLDFSVHELPVRGKQNSGKRPHVYFQEEDYFATELSERWEMIGQRIHAHLHRIDARQMRLFEKNGKPIGIARVRGRWKHSAHTVDQRRQINKLVRDGQLRLSYDEDPISAHFNDISYSVSEGLNLSAGKVDAVMADIEKVQQQQLHAKEVAGRAMESIIKAATKEFTPSSKNARKQYTLPGLKSFSRVKP